MVLRYVLLSDLFPNVSRATRWRWRKKGKIRKPDLIINGREYYLEGPLAPPAEDARDSDQPEAHTK